MKIVAIADDDSLVGHLEEVQTDVLLCLGDLWDSTIQRAMERYNPQITFAIRGNHDTNGPFPPGVTDLHGRTTIFRGVKFGGFGGSWRYKPRGHHLYEQGEVASALAAFPPVDIFIAHNSPAGIHEQDTDTHQGFKAFQGYIARTTPRMFLHGHQHVNQETVLGSATVIGVFGERLLQSYEDFAQ